MGLGGKKVGWRREAKSGEGLADATWANWGTMIASRLAISCTFDGDGWQDIRTHAFNLDPAVFADEWLIFMKSERHKCEMEMKKVDLFMYSKECDMDSKPPYTLIIKWDGNRVSGIEKKTPPLWVDNFVRDEQIAEHE
jgi:hypothetical protein